MDRDTYNTLTDEELIKAFKKGDSDAFTALINRYKKLLSFIARKYYLVGYEADDMLQEGCIGLMKAVYNYDSTKDCGFKSFALLCIENHIKTIIRTNHNEKNRILQESISLSSILEDKSANNNYSVEIDGFYHSIFVDEFLNISKDILSDLETRVLNYYLSGMSYLEISTVTNINYKSVDNAIQRIKRKLHPLYLEYMKI